MYEKEFAADERSSFFGQKKKKKFYSFDTSPSPSFRQLTSSNFRKRKI